MPTVRLFIDVSTRQSVSPEAIAQSVRQLIDIGLSDAANTIEGIGCGYDGDVAGAELATELNISAPSIATPARALVTVSGGVADYICDDGVDVEVFDWDNWEEEEEEHRKGVPSHFADLAEPINVPVEGCQQLQKT